MPYISLSIYWSCSLERERERLADLLRGRDGASRDFRLVHSLEISADRRRRGRRVRGFWARHGPHASEVTVDGGYLLRLLIPLPGPDGQMRNPVMVNFIDVYLQMLNDIVSSTGWRQANLPSQRRAV